MPCDLISTWYYEPKIFILFINNIFDHLQVKYTVIIPYIRYLLTKLAVYLIKR